MKTRTSAMTVLTGKRDSKIQDGEDVDVLRSSDLNNYDDYVQYKILPYQSVFVNLEQTF